MGARAIRPGEKLMDDMRPSSWVHRMQPIVSAASTRMSMSTSRKGPLRAFDTTSVIFGPDDASPWTAAAIGGQRQNVPKEAFSRWYFVHVSRGGGCHECMRPSSSLQVRAGGRTEMPCPASCMLHAAVQSSHRASHQDASDASDLSAS